MSAKRNLTLLFLALTLALLPSFSEEVIFDVVSDVNESFNQTYLYLDVYLTGSTTAVLYGETNLNISIESVIVQDGFILGKTSNLISLQNNLLVFDFLVNETIDSISITLYLPENATLKNINTNLDTWFSSEAESRVAFIGEFLSPSVILSYLPTENEAESDSRIPYVFVIIAGALVLFTLVLYKFRSKQPNKLEAIMSTLNEREKLLVKTLLEHGGELKQKVLEKDHQIPKASLSRILFHMEKKGLITRHRLGRTQRIVLNSDYK